MEYQDFTGPSISEKGHDGSNKKAGSENDDWLHLESWCQRVSENSHFHSHFPWISHGFPMDFPWVSMASQLMSCNGCHATPWGPVGITDPELCAAHYDLSGSSWGPDPATERRAHGSGKGPNLGAAVRIYGEHYISWRVNYDVLYIWWICPYSVWNSVVYYILILKEPVLRGYHIFRQTKWFADPVQGSPYF